MNYGVYCTRDQLKEVLIEHKADRASLVKADDALLRVCIRASRSIDSMCERWFYPISDTYQFDHPNQFNSIHGCGLSRNGVPRAVMIDWDLLEITTFTTNEGSTTFTASDYGLTRS